jgi:hypothetical protein
LCILLALKITVLQKRVNEKPLSVIGSEGSEIDPQKKDRKLMEVVSATLC